MFNYTFYGCSNLQYAYLPKCLNVGNGTFAYCKSLSYVVFRDLLAVPLYSSGNTGAFYSCPNL